MLRYVDVAGLEAASWRSACTHTLTVGSTCCPSTPATRIGGRHCRTRNASGPAPGLVQSHSKALAIWPSPALGTPTRPFRSTMRRIWSASLRSPDHSIADDHVPALPPPGERWPKTGPHVSDNYPAGRQQPVVFPRVAVDNMEGSRVAIIGFEDLTYRYPESSAYKRVEHKNYRCFIRNRPLQHASGYALHFFRQQPRPGVLYIASCVTRQLIIDLHAEYAPEGQPGGNEEYPPLA